MILPRRSSSSAAVLHWDGTVLHGAPATGPVTVTVPLRLVALHRESLPPAPLPALKAAVRLKAERQFAVLGPVAVEAVLYPVREGRCTAVLLALPETILTGLRQAAQERQCTVGRVRIAEFQVPVPTGGLVECAGERTLVALADGEIRAVAALGATVDERTLARERRRLGIEATAPGAPAVGQDCDFLHPTLTAVPPWFARPGMRSAALAAGLVGVLLLGGALLVADALAAQAAVHAEADRLKPLATVLAAERADGKAVAGWFDERPDLAPALAALAGALPQPGGDTADDQVRLVRVRQIPGEVALAEGVAADRAQMLGFLARLRQDPRILAADIRTYRTPTKGSTEVAFELTFRLKSEVALLIHGGSHAGA